MDAMGSDEQEEVLAARVKGEVTVEPLAGLATVGLAKAVAARSGRETERSANLQIFMDGAAPERGEFWSYRLATDTWR